MQTNENCSRYLSDVKHPAKKLKNNEELQKLQNDPDSDQEDDIKSSRNNLTSSQTGPRASGLSKSSICTLRISELCQSEQVQSHREMQFEKMV